ncbi:RhuM family protein [Parabacteroides segnis]|uniref:RhuM family protein n=1 Tax=Parabacteroides segnis TaxID=2763058 RepID=UPI003514941F
MDTCGSRTALTNDATFRLYLSVWLTQAQIAELFETTPQNITLHIKNVYSEQELEMDSTCKGFLQVRQEGSRTVKRMQKFFNLDVIISVGYRVKSKSSPDMSHRSLTCWGF